MRLLGVSAAPTNRGKVALALPRPGSALQIRKHREDAAMVGGHEGKVELLQDAAQVLSGSG